MNSHKLLPILSLCLLIMYVCAQPAHSQFVIEDWDVDWCWSLGQSEIDGDLYLTNQTQSYNNTNTPINPNQSIQEPLLIQPDRQAGIYKSRFYSQENQSVGYTIYLPYAESDPYQEYPVVYFLHGAGGNECNYLKTVGNDPNAPYNLSENNQIPPTIFVMVNGGARQFYVDADDFPNDPTKIYNIESMITQELIPHIDNNFRTIANRSGRAIQGFSMGGMGSLYIASRNPHLFSSIVALSSACGADTISCDTSGDGQNNLIEQEILAQFASQNSLLKQTTFYLGHGEFDVEDAGTFHEKIDARFFQTGLYDGQMHEYPGVRHWLDVMVSQQGKTYMDFHHQAFGTSQPPLAPGYIDYLQTIEDFASGIANIFDINSIIRSILN